MIFLVFIGHSMMPFLYGGDWHITNPDRTVIVTALIGFGFFWGMPLFFLVAGASAGASLYSRGARTYLKERFTRLYVPFAIAMVTIAPIQKYLERLHNKTYSGSFFSFYPQFFRDVHIGWNTDLQLDSYHLWFIQYLFDYCILALPLFLWLGSPSGRRTVNRTADLMVKPGVIFLCAAPAAVIQALVRPLYPNYGSWANFWFWLIFFVYGYFLTADRRFERVIVKNGLWGLTLGVVGFGILGLLSYFLSTAQVERWQTQPSYTFGCVVYSMLTSLLSVSWVVCFMAFNIRFFNVKTKWLRRANEAVPPIYILHHLVITIVAYYVVRFSWSILPKFLAIAGVSFVVTILVYVYLIRLISPLRRIFGMRPQQQPAPVAAESPSTSIG